MAKLTRRKGKGNWEIQYPLPKKLRTIKGTTALYRSLETSDKAEAKRRFPIKQLEVQAEIDTMMREYFPDEENLFADLYGLLKEYKDASPYSESDEVPERSIVLEQVEEWAGQQRRKLLQPFKGTPEYRSRRQRLDGTFMVKADEIITDALDPRKKVADLIEAWRKDVRPRLSASTKEEYDRSVRRFADWSLANRIVSFEDVTRQKVRQFIEETFKGRSGKTVKLAISGLRGVWDHAVTLGWIDERATVWDNHNYSEKVRIGEIEAAPEAGEELPFTFDDIRVVLTSERIGIFADMFRLGLITGMRSGEVSSLRVEDVTLEDDGYWISVNGGKTKSAKRVVPVPLVFGPLMERLTNGAGAGGYLIPMYDHLEFATERDRNRHINKKMNGKRRELEIPDNDKKGHHSCRRTYTELLEGAGVVSDTTKLLVGHRRSDITYGRYSKGQMVDLRSAVDLLEYPEDIVGMINQE